MAEPSAPSFWRAPSAPGGKLAAPAAARNRDAILAVLRQVLPAGPADVLEIAAGTGEHAVHFAAALPGLQWYPADLDEAHLASIEAWRLEAGLANLHPASRIDVTDPDWPGATAPARPGAIVCINMIHIAPPAATGGLLSGAAAKLAPGGVLYLYGPYMRDGAHTAPSNAAFDASLRARDPDWGLRDVADVTASAAAHGLQLSQLVEMPANNLSLVFTRLAG